MHDTSAVSARRDFSITGWSLSAGNVLVSMDILCLSAAWILVLRWGCTPDACTVAAPDIVATLLFPIADLVALYALGLYRRDTLIETRKALVRVPLAVSIGAVGSALVLSALALWLGKAPGLLLQFAAAIIAFSLAAVVARLMFCALKRRGMFRRRLLIVGAGRRAWDLVWMLRNEGSTPNYDITFVHDDAFGEIDTRLKDDHPGRIQHLSYQTLLDVARRTAADEIVVAPDERRGMGLEGLLSCKTAGFPVTQYLTFLEHEIRRVDIKRIEVGWLLYSGGFYFGTMDQLLKRCLDILVSVVFLILFAPFICFAAVAVKAEDGGPVFYRQERITRLGRTFSIYKIRTMRTDAEKAGAVWAATRDPRVTRIGSFLRLTRIDEMPQLVNVLRGDMSLVGPRPERPQFVRDLSAQLPLYDERHQVKAGLTGWAQINYPYGASIDDARSKLSYDLYYVKNFSILFDLLIILQTVRVVLTPSGAR
jgi:sugar transferase (PEP-CTERM system associated)